MNNPKDFAPIPTEEQINELSDFLDEHCSSDGDTGIDLSMLDGYLTAGICCPKSVPMDEWLRRCCMDAWVWLLV